MKIIKSHILDEAARASKRWEDAEAMMRHWSEPSKTVVKEWDKARKNAEAATRTIFKELEGR